MTNDRWLMALGQRGQAQKVGFLRLGGGTKFIIEIRYDPRTAHTIYTLFEQKFRPVIQGGKADGFVVEGSWVAIETGTAYLVLDAKDGLPVCDLCREVATATDGVKVRAVPVVPIKELGRLPG
jgi:hypothetical protein